MSPNRSPSLIVALSSATSLVMLTQLLAGKAARDALFLTNFDASVLPYAIVAAGLVSLVSAAPAARLVGRFGPARVVPWLFEASALLFLVEWLAIERAPKLVSGFLYLHLAAATAVLISGFWSTVNERFDPHSAKRNIARVSSFATLGGLLGGLLSERITAFFGIHATLIVMGAMHALCGALMLAMGRSEESGADEGSVGGAKESGLSILLRTPYLRLMLGAGFLLAMLDALLDWAFKAQAAATFHTSEDLIRFFGIFYTGVGLATFLVQSLFAHRLLARLGIGPSMSIMPVAVGLMGGVVLVIPRMASVVIMRALGSVLTNSAFRTGFELLYTPLPLRMKRPTKTYVDVGGQRIGDVVGGGLLLAILAIMSETALSGVLVIIMALVIVLTIVLRRLQQAYREQLATNLQSGEISLESLDSIARNVAETQLQLDRREILARLHERRAQTSEGVREQPVDESEVGRLVDALGDPIRAAQSAARLRSAGAEVSSALLAALCDPERAELEKLLLPDIVAQTPSAEVMTGLLGALSQPGFEFRFRCGSAAAGIAASHPELCPDREAVLRAVRDEIAIEPPTAAARRAVPGDDRVGSLLLSAHPDLRVARRIEHIFNLLALHFDVELMRTVLLGLHSSSPQTRGTALEYVEVWLPDDLRRAVLTLVGLEAGAPSRRHRAARQIEIELRRAAQASIVDRGKDQS